MDPWKLLFDLPTKRSILWLLCLIHGFTLQAQNISSYRIDDEDGLPSNEIYQTLQDDFGFIWIASDAGLYRYDGFKFREYSSRIQNSRSVSHLKLDRSGTLWCQNFTGQILRVEKDSLQVFYDASAENSQYPAFAIDHSNHVWISSNESIKIFDQSKQLIKKIDNRSIGQNLSEWLAFQEMDDRVIVVDRSGHFFCIHSSSYLVKTILAPAPIGHRNMFFQQENGVIVFSEESPVRRYHILEIGRTKLSRRLTIEPDEAALIYYFYKEIGEYTFLGTSNGLWLSRNGESVKKYFAGMKVSDIQLDKEGNYWVSTLQDGIIVLPNPEIEVYETDNSVLEDKNLYHLSVHANQLYVGTYSGEIYQHDGKDEFKKVQQNPDSRFRAIRKILFHKGVQYVACGPLVVTGNPTLNELPELNNIRDMIILEDRLYFTTPDRSGYVDLKSPKPSVHIIRKKGGKKVIADPNGKQVFFACTDGLFIFQNERLKELKYQGTSLFISTFFLQKGKLWAGTMNDGLYTADLNQQKIVFAPVDLISGKSVRSIYIGSVYCWISTEIGLNRIRISDQQLTIFNKHDGINFIEINDLQELKGSIYLATIRGLIRFPIHTRGNNLIKPKIAITGVRIGQQFLESQRKVEIDADQRGFTVFFATTAFRSRGNYNYEYRILNYDEEWKRLSASSPSVSITGLPAGNYVFEVRAVNEDGIESEQPAVLSIEIKSPFYMKWWFFVLMILALVGLTAYLFLLRIRFLQRKAKAKNRLILSQLTALKAQMNPHFMYNTLSSIQDFIWQNDTKNSNYYLSKFSLLMRKILDASDSSKISLNEEIEILSLYLELEQLRFGSSFVFEMTVDEEIDADHIYIPAMIIQPFVENAIKHGLLHKTGDKRLNVHFSLKENELHCLIIDNGIGRAKAEEIKKRQEAQHRSFATKATQKRIELLSLYDDSLYSFTITDLYEDGEASGTKVELILPFRNS